MKIPFLHPGEKRDAAQPSVGDLFTEVRRLEIVTRGAVDTLLQGSYRSSFRGQGLEFHQVREYTPEDDIRAIDWNVTARLNAPFVKTFLEERELHMVLAVDYSASLLYGSGLRSKRETAFRLASALSFAASRQMDRVGVMVFTDRVEFFRPPQRGRGAALRVLRDLVGFRPVGHKTDYRPAFHYLIRALKRRTILFLISDFTSPIPASDAAVLSRRHDLVAAVVHDPLEEASRLPARVAVRDPETGKVGYLGPGSQKAFEKARAFREAQLSILTHCGADRLDVSTNGDIGSDLTRFFRRRLERQGRR
jgi:uncharacterized protein (DUF58 family)